MALFDAIKTFGFLFQKTKKSAIDSPPGCFYKSFEYRRKHFADYCVVFDIACRRTYCKEALQDVLNLKPIRCELIFMKRFAAEEGVLKQIDAVQICVKYCLPSL